MLQLRRENVILTGLLGTRQHPANARRLWVGLDPVRPNLGIIYFYQEFAEVDIQQSYHSKPMPGLWAQ